MRANKPIILHIPAAFIQGLNKYLEDNKPNFKYDIINFYYIVHFILEQQIKNRNRDENKLFIFINMEILKSITVYNINEYVKILKNGEFIISDNQYLVGEKSIGYTINPIYFKGIEKFEIKTESKLFKKIIKNERRKKAHNNRLEPFLKLMRDEFMKVELDYENAEKWILSQQDEVKKISYMIALSLLKDERLRYFNRNKTNNRLDTNLTNLKSYLKQFIIGDYVNIDLKNSQPFFLSMLLETIINLNNNIKINNKISKCALCNNLDYVNLVKTFGIKRIEAILKIHQINKKAFLVNLKNFTESVIRGEFYDDFIKSYYGDNISDYDKIRKEVKNTMFKVLFSQNENYKKFYKQIPFAKEKKLFEAVYPFVYESIKMLKTKGNSKNIIEQNNNKKGKHKLKDHAILAVFLQKIESHIFIDCIAKEVVNSGIVPLTIHDSIIVKAEYKEKTIEIINKIFMENFNATPTLNIEPINKFKQIHNENTF